MPKPDDQTGSKPAALLRLHLAVDSKCLARVRKWLRARARYKVISESLIGYADSAGITA